MVRYFQKSGNRKPPAKRKRDRHEAVVSISDVRPKYTEGGISFTQDADSRSTKGRGWSEAGRVRFNELVDLVTKSREDHPNFLKNFVEKEQEKLVQKKSFKSCSNKLANIVLPKNDQFCDDEIENNLLDGSESDSDCEESHHHEKQPHETSSDDDEDEAGIGNIAYSNFTSV